MIDQYSWTSNRFVTQEELDAENIAKLKQEEQKQKKALKEMIASLLAQGDVASHLTGSRRHPLPTALPTVPRLSGRLFAAFCGACGRIWGSENHHPANSDNQTMESGLKENTLLNEAAAVHADGYEALRHWAAGQILIGTGGVRIFTSDSRIEYVAVNTGEKDVRVAVCKVFSAASKPFEGLVGKEVYRRVIGYNEVGRHRPTGIRLP